MDNEKINEINGWIEEAIIECGETELVETLTDALSAQIAAMHPLSNASRDAVAQVLDSTLELIIFHCDELVENAEAVGFLKA